MSKKKLWIIVVVAGVLVLGLAAWWLIKTGKSKTGTATGGEGTRLPLFTNEEESEGPVTADLSYKDAAGFSFSYPKGITVRDTTPDDDQYYSQLQLSKSEKVMTISVFDSAEGSLEAYIKKQKPGATLVGAATLGGLSAKQYSLGGSLLSLALDQGVLYLIEGPEDGGYWEEVQGLILSSFSFGEKAKAANGASEAIYEEEEIVQ